MNRVDIVRADDPRFTGLVELIPPQPSEAAWLAAYAPDLGPNPQVNRFEKSAPDRYEFAKIEVHRDSPQLTIAWDAELLVTVFAGAWGPGDEETPIGAVSVPPGWGSIIAAGIWHSGVVALGDTAVTAAFRPGTLPDGTQVHSLDSPIQLNFTPSS